MSIQRTIAIGDVHGCVDLLHRLLDKLPFTPSTDRLVFVGDLIDRGPNPVQVVRHVHRLANHYGAVVIKGNHEDKCVNWLDSAAQERKSPTKPNRRHPPSPERRKQWEALSPEEVDWLRDLPTHLEVAPGWLAVHAGFENIPMAEQRLDKMCRVRFVSNETGKMKGTDIDNPVCPPGCSPWMSLWRGPQNVVYGHAVHGLDQPRVDQPAPGVETWGIDTGATYGGNLTALVLETREVIQVRDGKAYAKLYTA